MDTHDGLGAVLARNWWAVLVRGLLAVGFGLIALLQPDVTMLSLVLVFSAYTMADGIFAIVAAIRAAGNHGPWGPLLLEGIVDILVAAATFLMPGLTVVVFVFLVAFWAVATGVLMLSAAFRLGIEHGRWWLALGGLASVLYGAVLLIAPMIGALVLTWWIGVYALVFGVAMIALAFKLKSRLA